MAVLGNVENMVKVCLKAIYIFCKLFKNKAIKMA